MCRRSIYSCRVHKQGSFVEFDLNGYFKQIKSAIKGLKYKQLIDQISFTGQAESLVLLDQNNIPVMNSISWMDSRSEEECLILSDAFNIDEIEKITGQISIIPTWPATKIMWIKKHLHQIFEVTKTYLL